MRNDRTSAIEIGEPLRFAHLTDAHLTDPRVAAVSELCNKRILSYVSWRRRRRFLHDPVVLAALVEDLKTADADHLAISGDLTNLGLPRECRDALDWLLNLAPAERVSLVPGNHDRLVAAPWEDTVGLWARFMASDADTNDGPVCFPSLRVRGPVAFIGLSSAVPTPPLLATGRLGDDQLARLADLLESTRRRGLFRVMIIHHPPIPGAYKWRKRLLDADAVQTLIRRHGAELVLHGHTHRITSHRLQGPDGEAVPVVGLASASSTEEAAAQVSRYSLWTVTPRPDGYFGLVHESRRYDPEVGGFRRDPDWNPLPGD